MLTNVHGSPYFFCLQPDPAYKSHVFSDSPLLDQQNGNLVEQVVQDPMNSVDGGITALFVDCLKSLTVGQKKKMVSLYCCLFMGQIYRMQISSVFSTLLF